MTFTPPSQRHNQDVAGGRHSITAPAPLWSSFEDVQDQMLWDMLDSGHTSRALVRLACAIAWMLLAVSAGLAAWWWGLPMLAIAPLILLHGQRRWALAVIDRTGSFSVVLRKLLPYPQSPGFHPLGLLDFGACCFIGAGTGWIGNAFGSPATLYAAPAASILAAGAIIPGALNMTAHVSWELETAKRREVWRRPLVSLVSAAFVVFVLWPRPGAGRVHHTLEQLAVLAALFTLAIGTYGQWLLTHESHLIRLRSGAMRRAVQDADSHHVHQLKNLARSLYEQHQEITPSFMGERVRDLAIAIAATENMLKAGSPLPNRGVTEILSGLVGIDDSFAALREVTEEVDPETITPVDAEMLLIAVGDLASNAIKANADRFTVGVRATPEPYGSMLTLTATCKCATVLRSRQISDDSSLMRLASKVESIRGKFLLAEDGTGCHTFTLCWPTTARPTARDTAQ